MYIKAVQARTFQDSHLIEASSIKSDRLERIMRDLRLVPLTAETVAKAYPLIQIARPRVSLGAWRRRAEAILSQNDPQRIGLQTLQDPRGLIVGLFAYEVGETLDHGRTLFVGEFVAVDIIASGQVANRLALEMEQLAQRCRCSAVHTDVAEDSNRRESVMELLSALGHHPENSHLCKPLVPAR